ncbi:MAG: V-type ATP synthase subunit I [Ruminococcaceae bacterium]|nr:V-type ATP synthase subunit I [Oscillospiraceae bacterium]
MAIVRMKRLHILGLSENRERVMRLLSFVGAVEVSEVPLDGNLQAFGNIDEIDKLRENLSSIEEAIGLSKKYSEFKSGMFTPRIQVTEKELFSSKLMLDAISEAQALIRRETKISNIMAEKSKLQALKESFEPWKKLGVSLEAPEGKFFSSMMVTVPAAASLQMISESVSETSDCAEVFEVSSEAELRYLFVVFHKSVADEVFNTLKKLGGAKVNFRGVKSAAKERIAELEKKIAELEVELKETEKEMKVSREVYEKLLTAEDAITTHLEVAEATGLGVVTDRTFYIEGWCPAREEKTLSEFFEKQGCAYEFADPGEGEEPPTLTYNSRVVSPFNMITNMYSPPAYTGIDPNPTMAPFFALFFGIMLSDAGYGLLLMLAGIFALKKLSPRGGFKSFMQLAVICGASTVFWGVLFGGFFGDAIPSMYLLFTGNTFPYDLALWFNPTNDPMTMLIFSLVLGGVQIVAGMAVKAYMMIRDGHILDAIFDIGLWWVVFGGAITCIFNAQVGLYVLLAGVVGLVLTQGRAKKNIVMKFFSGVLSLYDVTGYFSDILSYSRLLALSLSTAVVGNVINTMGVITGPVFFFLVFIIGHVFNIAINLVGSFVHSARLQYVEYFGKFYESGGRLFSPLAVKTKNTDIIKEEN